VPVHMAKDLSPEQAKAYRLADNQTADLATWDLELLPIELRELRDMDVDLALLGFADEALARLLGGDVAGGLTDPDAVPEPPDEATTRPGDLWTLGEHRLLCGDRGKAEDVDRLLDGQPVHLVNTDPPYNVKVAPRSNNATDVWSVKKVSPQSMVHLTEKPVELALRAIQYSTRPGETVLDLFGGSGSTLIACEQTRRRACLCELDPLYCDVIVRRWEEFTGRTARRRPARTGS